MRLCVCMVCVQQCLPFGDVTILPDLPFKNAYFLARIRGGLLSIPLYPEKDLNCCMGMHIAIQIAPDTFCVCILSAQPR